MVAFDCSQLLGSGLAFRIVTVWGLNDAVLATTAIPSNHKKRMIPCDAFFYNQLHVTSRRAVVGQFGLSHVCPPRNFDKYFGNVKDNSTFLNGFAGFMKVTNYTKL